MHVAHLLTEDADLAARAAALRGDPDAEFPVLSAKIKLTWRCNLRCRMCSLWRLPGARTVGPTELPVDLVADTLTALARCGLRKIHFSGGEALLYGGLQDVVRCARELGLQVNMTTNGTLLDNETVRFLVEERVHTVAVSIDSSDEREHDRMRGEKGAWRAAWRGIGRLAERRHRKKRGPVIAVNTLITRSSAPELGRLYDMLLAHGVDSWRLLPIDTESSAERPTADQWRDLASHWGEWAPLLARPPVDWSSERSAERAAKGKYAGVFYSRHACFAPWFNVFIDADGKVYPCCMGKRDMRPYGNVLDIPVEELLTGERRREIRMAMASGNAFPVCEFCDDFLEENDAFGALAAPARE